MKNLTQRQFQEEYERITGEMFAYSKYGNVNIDETVKQIYDQWIAEYDSFIEEEEKNMNDLLTANDDDIVEFIDDIHRTIHEVNAELCKY